MHLLTVCVFLVIAFTIKCDALGECMKLISLYGNNFPVTLFGYDKINSISFSRLLSLEGFQNRYLLQPERLTDYNYFGKHLFIVNLDHELSIFLLTKANERRLFSKPFHWFLLRKSGPIKPYADIFGNLSILVDSDVTIADIYEGEIHLRKIYKRHYLDEALEVENIGLWTKANNSMVYGIESNDLRRRKNLSIHLNTCLVITHNESIHHLTDKRDKHIDSITKVNYVLVVTVASIYNVTLNISISNTWGYKNNNSQWTGMMGELVRKEVDIGGTSLFLIKERIDLIDYIAMISPTRSKFVFRQPKLSYVTNVYTLPFDYKVWMSTVVLVVLMTVTLFILFRWETNRTTNSEDSRVNHKNSFPDVTFITIGAICQQGTTTLPHSIPGRIATLFLFVSLMFIYVSYSANIVALLQTSSTSIKTLEDLLNSRLQVGVDDTVFNHFYFTTAVEPVRKALYERKVAIPGRPPNFMHIEEGVRRMRQGLFAFHMETGSGYKLVSETFREDEKCGLQEIQYLQVVDPWIAIQKNSSYKKMFTIGFRLLQENGLQHRENSLIYTRKPTCTSKSSTFISVGLVDCYPAAAIFAGGVCTALVIFLLELYTSYMIRKNF